MKTPAIRKLLSLGLYFLPLIAFAANFTESRTHVGSPPAFVPHDSSVPLKVTIYRSHGGPLVRFARMPASSAGRPFGKAALQEVKAYVSTQASEQGVNPKLALWIVKHESGFNPAARGDGDASRGLWQISRVYHPEVSDDQAFSVTSSTKWSLDRIRSGKVNEWSSYRNCKILYRDCPF